MDSVEKRFVHYKILSSLPTKLIRFLIWCLMLSILIVHFFLRYTICCCWKNVCRFHCLYSRQDEIMTPEKVLTRFDNFFYLLWCQWQSHFEWISIPRNSFFWHGFKINFLIFIIKSKFYRRYKIVSWLMWAFVLWDSKSTYRPNILSLWCWFFSGVRLEFPITL